MVGQYLKIEEGTSLHCWTVEPQKSNSPGVQEVPEIRTTKTITMGGERVESETQMEENSMTHTLRPCSAGVFRWVLECILRSVLGENTPHTQNTPNPVNPLLHQNPPPNLVVWYKCFADKCFSSNKKYDLFSLNNSTYKLIYFHRI